MPEVLQDTGVLQVIQHRSILLKRIYEDHFLLLLSRLQGIEFNQLFPARFLFVILQDGLYLLKFGAVTFDGDHKNGVSQLQASHATTRNNF